MGAARKPLPPMLLPYSSVSKSGTSSNSANCSSVMPPSLHRVLSVSSNKEIGAGLGLLLQLCDCLARPVADDTVDHAVIIFYRHLGILQIVLRLERAR